MTLTYFISAIDMISFVPIIREQAVLELLKSYHRDVPIDGKIILNIRKGYRIKCRAVPELNGFNYEFIDENNNNKQ